MDLTSLQFILPAFEYLALAIGTILLCRQLYLPGFKPAGRHPGRLAYWPVEGFELALLVLLVLLVGIIFQAITVNCFDHAIKAAVDRKGLEMAVYQAAFHSGGLVAWPTFYLLRRRLFASYSATPPTSAGTLPIRASWALTLRDAVVTFLSALPLVTLVSVSWTSLLNLLGLPNERQDLIATFQNTQSTLVLAGMFFVACVLVPINEEMLFRRGFYHFLRQRSGRVVALTLSAGIFGLMHFNLAGFLPLATFGVMLALAYERTGNIRVPIIAHGLFNLLNIIVALLDAMSAKP